MKHELTLQERLAGAIRARSTIERKGRRYRGLLVGIDKNISQLKVLLAMPYKDRETYLRKQREFAARRKARKLVSRVNAKSLLTAGTNIERKVAIRPAQNMQSVSGKTRLAPGSTSVRFNPTVPSTPITPRPSIFSFRRAQERKPEPQVKQAPAPAGSGSGLGSGLRFKPAAKEQFTVDDLGNAFRLVKA